MEDTILSANLELKKELVESIKAEFKEAKSLIFVDYRGITVAEDTTMRKEFRENGVTYKVYKNRLMTRALDELGITGYDAKLFEGTTAVAFGTDEVAPAKIFCNNQITINCSVCFKHIFDFAIFYIMNIICICVEKRVITLKQFNINRAYHILLNYFFNKINIIFFTYISFSTFSFCSKSK